MSLSKNNNHTVLAQQISWQPIKKSNPLKNMILQSIEGTLELHLSIMSRLFYATLILLGSILTIYATIELLSYDFHNTFWSAFLGFTLTGIGLYLYSKHALSHVFDKEKNLFFKENENLEKEDETPLHTIHALQVISYIQENEGKDKKRAELNLVLNNGKRVYVCSYDTHEYERVEKDVQKISNYLNKPIWAETT